MTTTTMDAFPRSSSSMLSPSFRATMMQGAPPSPNGPTLARGAAGHCMTPLSKDFKPSPEDFIVGRGRAVYQHPGNVKFRQLVAMRLPQYSQAMTKLAKSVILSDVVGQIRTECLEKNGTGGFVKRGEDGCWFEVGDFLAREKTSQAFRDALRGSYRSSSAAKTQARRLQLQQQHQGQNGYGNGESSSRRHSSASMPVTRASSGLDDSDHRSVNTVATATTTITTPKPMKKFAGGAAAKGLSMVELQKERNYNSMVRKDKLLFGDEEEEDKTGKLLKIKILDDPFDYRSRSPVPPSLCDVTEEAWDSYNNSKMTHMSPMVVTPVTSAENHQVIDPASIPPFGLPNLWGGAKAAAARKEEEYDDDSIASILKSCRYEAVDKAHISYFGGDEGNDEGAAVTGDKKTPIKQGIADKVSDDDEDDDGQATISITSTLADGEDDMMLELDVSIGADENFSEENKTADAAENDPWSKALMTVRPPSPPSFVKGDFPPRGPPPYAPYQLPPQAPSKSNNKRRHRRDNSVDVNSLFSLLNDDSEPLPLLDISYSG